MSRRRSCAVSGCGGTVRAPGVVAPPPLSLWARGGTDVQVSPLLFVARRDAVSRGGLWCLVPRDVGGIWCDVPRDVGGVWCDGCGASYLVRPAQQTRRLAHVRPVPPQRCTERGPMYLICASMHDTNVCIAAHNAPQKYVFR